VELTLDIHWVVLAFLLSGLIAIIRYFTAKLLNNPYFLISAKQALVSWVDSLFLLAVILALLQLFPPLLERWIEDAGWDVALGMSCEGYCLPNLSAKVIDKHLEVANGLVKEVVKGVPVRAFSNVGAGADTIYLLYSNFQYSNAFVNEFTTLKARQILGFVEIGVAPLVVLKVFLERLAYPLGILFLSLGVVLRAFSYTARAGGALVAAGITSLVALPFLTVLFMSPSLIAGTSGLLTTCPSACTLIPAGVERLEGTVVYSENLTQWVEEGLISEEERLAFLNGSIDSLTVGYTTYRSCTALGRPSIGDVEAYIGEDVPPELEDEAVQNYTCPTLCRVLPFPNAPECRKAEPFCRELYEAEPLCFQPLVTSYHLREKVRVAEGSVPLGEAMASTECFTVEPLLPFSLEEKSSYPFPIPQSCRYLILTKDGGSWEASLSGECRNLLRKLDTTTRDSVEDVVMSYNDSLGGKVDSAKAWLRDPRHWVVGAWDTHVISFPAPDRITVLNGTPPLALSPVGYVVKGNCSALSAPTSKLHVPKGVDCGGCSSSAPMDDTADKVAFLLSLGWAGSALAVGSSAMFLIALSMALEGFMFIPGLRRLV